MVDEKNCSVVKKKTGYCHYCRAPVPHGVKICSKCKALAEKRKKMLYCRCDYASVWYWFPR